MRKKSWPYLICIGFLMLILSGCASEVDKAIQNLEGSEEEVQLAIDTIKLSPTDPLPDLRKAINNKKLSPAIRIQVAKLIGSHSDSMGDDSAVDDMLKALNDSEEEVQLAIMGALDMMPGEKCLHALQDLLDSDVESLAKGSWNILNTKALAKKAEADALSGGSSFSRKAEILAEAVAINPRNQDLVRELAGYYTLQGDNDKARELFNAGGKFVHEVMVVGPFQAKGADKGINPAVINTSVPVKIPGGQQLDWLLFDKIPDHGIIDFRRDRNTKISKSIFYTAFNVDSEADQEVLFRVYSRSEITVWVNGEEVSKISAKDARSKDEHEIKVQLKKGSNSVLAKLRSKKYARFSIRVSDMKYKLTDTIGFSL